MTGLFGFLKNRDGTIAVEFAFIAPIMMGLFFGLTQLALVLGVRNDVVNLASAGADLIAQEKTASTTDMNNVFSALSAMLYPYSTTPVQITLTSLTDNSSGGAAGNNNTTAAVAWSCTSGGTKRTGTYSFPSAAQGVITSGSGDSVIMAEVSYSYSLPFVINIPGFRNLGGPYVLTNTFYAKPRKVQTVTWSGTAC
jgi:Flp pilus assembly protein TadG